MIEISNFGEAKHSLCERLREKVEASSNAFEFCLTDSQSEIFFTDLFVEATVQLLYDVGLFDRFGKIVELVKEYITSIKHEERGELEIDKY